MPARPPKSTIVRTSQNFLSPTRAVIRLKRSHVPPRGWTEEEFRTANGRNLLNDMMLAQRASTAKGIRTLVKRLAVFFDDLAADVIKEFTTRAVAFRGVHFRSHEEDHDPPYQDDALIPISEPTQAVPHEPLIIRMGDGFGWAAHVKQLEEITLDPGSHQALWTASIETVMREKGLEFVTINTNAIQSTVDSSHAATINLLGGAPDRGVRSRINRRVKELASQVTGMNETTKTRLRNIVNRGIDNDLTVAEMAKTLRSEFKDLSRARISTIARTEMGQAADAGRTLGIQDTDTVLEVSVIGCIAREPNSPQYRGESTCNIQGVPVHDADKLVFHQNHTGTIVPSKFVGDEDLPVEPVAVDPIATPDVEPEPVVAPPKPRPTVPQEVAVPPEPEFDPETFDFESSASYPQANSTATESLSRYTDKQGNLTVERKALHSRIVDRSLAGTTAQAKPVAHMTGGGPASGKSVLFREGKVTLPDDIVTIDSDEIKKSLPEFNELVDAGDSTAAAFAHEESSVLSKRVMREASEGKRNLFLDGTGDSSFSKLKKKTRNMRRGGHRVVANYVTVDTEVAVARNIARAERTGRMVPNEFVRQTHRNISEILPAALEEGLFDEVTLWDTNTPGQTIKVMSQIDGVLIIHDQELWDRFLGKATETGP